ncbi:MAG: serine/threonine protein kinase, partial [Planctomycetaceae bacterium]|nr:serine/threonine protein kinase [Planctomycetaceae bacterium]
MSGVISSFLHASLDSGDDIFSPFVKQWEQGIPVSAADWLNAHAAYWEHRLVVLDLALEEYCQRIQHGMEVIHEDFCRAFGRYADDVAIMLQIEDACKEGAVAGEGDQLPVVGELFHGFEIIERLGSGGLAEVYLARAPENQGRRYCVLKISRHRTREASILGKLDPHSHIGKFHYVDPAGPTTLEIIVMPYRGRATLLDLVHLKSSNPQVDGGAIADLVAKGPKLPDFSQDRLSAWPLNCSYFDVVATLLGQVAEALDFSHDNKIVHGDLKPSNVLVDFSAEALLIDFNLAFDGLSSLYRLGGTPGYLAPELLRAVDVSPHQNQIRPTPATDVYAWGVVAWELLTGKVS